MMLDPHLNDSFTRKHITKLHFGPDSIAGAGISVKVFIDAVYQPQWQLYTKIYGEFDDNLVIVVNENHRVDIKSLEHESVTPIEQWYEGKPMINEFQLTKEHERILDVAYEEGNHYIEAKKSELSYLVHFHDNFIFYCTPLDDKIINCWLNAIFDLHNFYFKRDLNWEQLKADIIREIPHCTDLRLRSYPEKNNVVVSYKKPYEGWLSFIKKSSESLSTYDVTEDGVIKSAQ